MKKITFASIVFCMILLGISGFNFKKEKWISIFNGKNLDGWEQRGGEAKYEVINGEIVGTTVLNTPNSFMCTKKMYDNFILELELKVDTLLNSGIQIRSNSQPDFKNGVVHGYQVEIDPSMRAWSGGIYDEQRRGWLYNPKDDEKARKAFKPTEWNKYRIEAIGNTIKTWVNGIPVTDLKDDTDKTGFIGLQVHASDNPGLHVKWRNIKIQEK